MGEYTDGKCCTGQDNWQEEDDVVIGASFELISVFESAQLTVQQYDPLERSLHGFALTQSCLPTQLFKGPCFLSC